MELVIHPVELRLKDTFETAHSKRDVQQSLIIELKGNGVSGYGEATMNTYFGVTIEAITGALEGVRPLLENYQWGSPEQLHQLLAEQPIDNNFALCALDEAAYDLYGKQRRQHTYQYLGTNILTIPLSDYTIGIDTIDNMISKIKAMPWPVYKIKLGTEHDIAIIKALREHTQSVFRVDANCGWNVEETIENARELAELGVEFIEQPLPPADWKGMKKVFKHSVLPVIADESCMVETDVDLCVGHFHGINIKLTKCGGITVARRMIRTARSNGMKLMAGCMTESSVGISAVAQLLPQLDYADMDGALLIANDPSFGVTFREGIVTFPETYGNGVTVKW
jgi:L-alanine-DL-glutamate epimerase-like enolase superfamily enzyme